MEPLCRGTAPASALILESPPTLGIVHIGLGNFHRAHFAVHTAEAVASSGGDWGIYAYSLRSQSNADAMRAQDYLYSVVDIDPQSQKCVIPGIHIGASGGQSGQREVLRHLIDPRTRIISLTITEAGYCYSTQTGGLDETRPEIRHDIDNLDTPNSVIGLLAQALIERERTHRSPVTILSCDNLTSNGATTKKVLTEFAQKLNRENSHHLLSYLNTSTSFPNSMVDRIVPGTQERHRLLVAERLGIRDEIPVPAEKFSMWVMEDDFIAGRPAWEKSGVIFTNEVENFETMKLRLLNGSHSLLSYVGALAGKESVPEARFTPWIEDAIRHFMKKEMAPTFHMPRTVDLDLYIEQLFARWSNTVLSDTVARIGSDGSIKLPPRITQTSFWHQQRNNPTPLTALTLAAWLACCSPPEGFAPGSIAEAMKDPAREYLSSLNSDHASAQTIVERLFSQGRVFPREFNSLSQFKEQVSHYLELIVTEGIEVATKEATSS